MKSLWERRLKIGMYSELNDPFELLPYKLPDVESRRIMKLVAEVLSRDHGVLCFSEVWNSNLMWAHYADKHQGLCLGFDIPEGGHLTKIRYVKGRIKSPVELQRKPQGLDAGWFETCLNAKSYGWKYEREQRLRVSLEEKRDGLYFKKFDSNIALREVIVGARCSLTHEDIAEALGRPEYDVEIRTVRPAHTTFSMVTDKRKPSLIVKGIPAEIRKSRALADALLRHTESRGSGIIAGAMQDLSAYR